MQVPSFKSAEEDYSLKEMTKSTKNKAKKCCLLSLEKCLCCKCTCFSVYIFSHREHGWKKSDKSEKKSPQSFSEIKKFKQLCPSVSQACRNQEGEQ